MFLSEAVIALFIMMLALTQIMPMFLQFYEQKREKEDEIILLMGMKEKIRHPKETYVAPTHPPTTIYYEKTKTHAKVWGKYHGKTYQYEIEKGVHTR